MPKAQTGQDVLENMDRGSDTEWVDYARQHARLCRLTLYGKSREAMTYDRIVMLKTLRREVRVVWVLRNIQRIALVTTDLELSVEQIIEYYGAGWKIESGVKEIKLEIGSAKSQSRDPHAERDGIVVRKLIART